MDKQGKVFLKALKEHLDGISSEEFYERLKRNSHPEAKGQPLDDFIASGYLQDLEVERVLKDFVDSQITIEYPKDMDVWDLL